MKPRSPDATARQSAVGNSRRQWPLPSRSMVMDARPGSSYTCHVSAARDLQIPVLVRPASISAKPMVNMASELPFQGFPSFQSTVPHYLVGRPNYARSLIWIVKEHLHLAGGHRLLDLACGPGWLGVAFAPHVGAVMAVDPEPAMLAAARVVAAEAKVQVDLVQGSSFDLGPQLGRFQVVTIGRAFHWMDRADTLRRLDTLINPGGAVVLFNDVRPDVPENAWYKTYSQLVDGYASRDASIPPDRLRHEAVLLESSFRRLVRIGVIERRVVPIERLVDRALSMSTSSPEKLGPLSDRLAGELLAHMVQFATDGSAVEVVESQALIAQRQDEIPLTGFLSTGQSAAPGQRFESS